MKIAITDANIFIDLIHLGLCGKLFALGFEVHTAREVYEELHEDQQAKLDEFATSSLLTIHKPKEIELLPLLKANKGLSESDKVVVQLAIEINAFILTGDRLLKKTSVGNKVEVHGVLWLIAKFVEHQLVDKVDACEHITKLKKLNNRLPQDECDKMLKEWGVN
jgi:predicted nucleic acid-binding protein